MYLGIVKLSEVSRLRICEILCSLYFLKLLVSITILAFGAYLKVAISSLKHIYAGYHDDSLPYIFIGVGLISIITCVLTALACFSGKNIEHRKKTVLSLRVLRIINLVIAFMLLTIAVKCFMHAKQLSQAFDRGLRQSMAEYAYNPRIKYEVDELQMNFQCCGNQGHEDWFNVGWVLDKFNEPLPDLPHTRPMVHSLPDIYFRERRQSAPELEGASTTQDSVPFSCCDPRAHRPCISRFITNKVKHAMYDYSGHTLYKIGCTESIMDYLGGTLLTGGGVFALCTFILEIVLVVVMRYLETSMQVANEYGYPEVSAPGYLLHVPCCGEEEEEVVEEEIYEEPSMIIEDPYYYDDPNFKTDEYDEYAEGGEYASPAQTMSYIPSQYTSQFSHPSQWESTNFLSGYTDYNPDEGEFGTEDFQPDGFAEDGYPPDYMEGEDYGDEVWPSQPEAWPSQPDVFGNQPGVYGSQPGAYASQPGGFGNQPSQFPNNNEFQQ